MFRRLFNPRFSNNILTRYRNNTFGSFNSSEFAKPSNPVNSSVCLSSRFFSSDSFMQTVLKQVKKDLEKDKSLQEAMEKLESESQISEKISRISEYFEKTRDFSKDCINKISETKNSKIVRNCLDSAKSIAVGFDRVSSYLYDEKGHAKRIRTKMKLNKRKPESSKPENESVVTEPNDSGNDTPDNSLVLAKESVWDRFGSKIRDMPFLYEFFENPIISKLFGDTSLASALREMKRLDPSFNLPDLVELVEHVIAPHVVESYLKGDGEALKLHCGEVAFNILNTSIKERNLQKLVLDPSILILKNVELKGGMKVKEGDPWLIFNFTTQQINCLRDTKGKVCAGNCDVIYYVLGQIDDIREVVYSIAISRHPNPFENLEYPYMVIQYIYTKQITILM
ncbi:mitochondrial inner membrane subunit, putative [Theileria annulata]|uniref:Mitochondrial inner membrane subunit, putative n=1 Tax=Theileria annulata TaxID=5874 RepID=Q4UIE4_THEAN|nr:mitochondrial inner membrane subunit, putative [Theileria annulata]CAI73145.1 mitochondrial inner membrane subunit, putative [Theileria annulata]|eukprot:XP_953823.1 mitochondrial inner membrane subunit, putative [Theileria annulata]